MAATRAEFVERFVSTSFSTEAMSLIFFSEFFLFLFFDYGVQKCDERPDAEGRCETCLRLRLECLGFGAKQPDWLRVCVPIKAVPAFVSLFLFRKITMSTNFAIKSRVSLPLKA